MAQIDVPMGEKIFNAWQSWPGTAKWCVAFTVAQIAACVTARQSYEIGPMYKSVKEAVFTMTRNALIIPMALFTLIAMYQVAEMCSPKPRHRVLVISRVSMLEFMVKMTYYTLLSRGYGLAFVNQRSFDQRPIYATRYIGWMVAVPTTCFMNLYPLMDDRKAGDVLIRLLPQLASSSAYCCTCGLGCILDDPGMGWFLTFLGIFAHLVILADTIAFVGEHIGTTSSPSLKGLSVALKEIMTLVYASVFLLGNWGQISSYACQVFYGITDLSHLAVMCALLFLFWNTDAPKVSESSTKID